MVRDTRIHSQGMLDSAFGTPPKSLALGRPTIWCRSRFPPLRMLVPEPHGRGSSAIGLRRLSEVERGGLAHGVSEHPGVHDERAYSSGYTEIRLD